MPRVWHGFGAACNLYFLGLHLEAREIFRAFTNGVTMKFCSIEQMLIRQEYAADKASDAMALRELADCEERLGFRRLAARHRQLAIYSQNMSANISRTERVLRGVEE